MIDQDGNVIPEVKKDTITLTPYQIEQLDSDMHKELVKKASEDLARLLHSDSWSVVSINGKEGTPLEGHTWKEMRFRYKYKKND
tara:strand:+ start:57 stop:308 length:252 start_codon:yes stop_codon:yes gene_type:complete